MAKDPSRVLCSPQVTGTADWGRGFLATARGPGALEGTGESKTICVFVMRALSCSTQIVYIGRVLVLYSSMFCVWLAVLCTSQLVVLFPPWPRSVAAGIAIGGVCPVPDEATEFDLFFSTLGKALLPDRFAIPTAAGWPGWIGGASEH